MHYNYLQRKFESFVCIANIILHLFYNTRRIFTKGTISENIHYYISIFRYF